MIAPANPLAFEGMATFLPWKTPFLWRLRNILVTDLQRRNPILQHFAIECDVYEVDAPGPDDDIMLCIYRWNGGTLAMNIPNDMITLALEVH